MIKMTINHASTLFLFTLLMTSATSVQALDCGRASTVIENTICDNRELAWLDRVFTDSFRKVVMQNPQQIDKIVGDWNQTRDACISEACLREAYLNGIGRLYGANRPFDWQGTWWNTTDSHGNGGKILISNPTHWEFKMDASVWGGIYKSTFSGKVNILGGVGFTDKITWGGGCAIILVPRRDGKLEVSSDTNSSCDMLLPGEMAVDGVYMKSATDPRPAATLLSLGIFPDKVMDDRFRQLAGPDYQQYLATATSFVYGQDLDDRGATVLILWVKGMANRKSAMIMYTPEGKIWALRVEPTVGKELDLHYITTEKDKKSLPKTLANWRSQFIDR